MGGSAGNSLLAEGAASVVESLAKNSSLTSLDLCGEWKWGLTHAHACRYTLTHAEPVRIRSHTCRNWSTNTYGHEHTQQMHIDVHKGITLRQHKVFKFGRFTEHCTPYMVHTELHHTETHQFGVMRST